MHPSEAPHSTVLTLIKESFFFFSFFTLERALGLWIFLNGHLTVKIRFKVHLTNISSIIKKGRVSRYENVIGLHKMKSFEKFYLTSELVG